MISRRAFVLGLSVAAVLTPHKGATQARKNSVIGLLISNPQGERLPPLSRHCARWATRMVETSRS
jgi:hypothetical protein